MINKTAYVYMENLQYKVKDLTSQLEAFKSGDKYRGLEAYYEKRLAVKDREVQKLKIELGQTRSQYINVRKNWQDVIEDMEKEYAKELNRKDRAIEDLQKKIWDLQNTVANQKETILAQKKELYIVQTELEEEKGKVLNLKAQINRDHENSGIPSSQKQNRKKIENNREKTGRKPGGQPGHKGHCRKKHEPTVKIEIPPPEKFNDPGYKATGRIIMKQLVDIELRLIVTEYSTPEFRNVATGQRVHADFPDGLVNEVTYSGKVKAFTFLLNNCCNVSIKKASNFLCELTNGELRVSTGTINNLCKEFSEKSEPEQKETFANLLLSPVMYTDFTTARVNGKNKAVLVCATNTDVLFVAKEHKGHEGVKDTPVEKHQHTLVHDHDLTFYNYGSDHGECNEHVRRYLKDSIANEPNLTWNVKMRQLINKMMHFKSTLKPDDPRSPVEIEPEKVADFVAGYDEIVALAEKEYEYEPPSKYYMKGFNLYKRLKEYKTHHLLFLHDKNVDSTNNLSERHLRNFKRKQKQVMAFRSQDGLGYLCDSLGVIASIANKGKSLFDSVASIFSRNDKARPKD